MKVGDWEMRPIKRRRSPKSEPLADDVHIESMVAYKNNRRVLLHRVVKRHPDGRLETFIIRVDPAGSQKGH
ncbi:MAG: hypothetical protein V3U98_04630 [Acidobacteriota bacterium]